MMSLINPDIGLSGDLSLPQYWHLSKNHIAAIRKWGTISRSSSMGRLREEKSVEEKRAIYIRQCDRNMAALSPFLPDKPMADLTSFELLRAIQKSKYANGRVYAESTLKGRLSLLRDIYDYAEDRGDACNDLNYINDKQLTYYLKAVGLASKERKKLFQKLAREHDARPRSLTPAQQARLVRIILEHLEEDGRYLALAILLYTGMRPSECRGLNWYDWVCFQNHTDRHMLPLDRQRDNRDQLIDRLKRPASYRKIGVHFELEEIIRRRLEFMLKTYSSLDEIQALPMCCLKNEFSRGVTSAQLGALASKILRDSIRVPEEVMMTCTMDMFAYESPSSEDDTEDLRVSTYLLRHDFWTWMQASTELSAEEKRYLFGHSISDGRVDQRHYYNDETRLWDMLVKLDHTIKFFPLHEARLRGTLAPDSGLSVPNVGHYTLRLSPELLRAGGQVTIALQANEYNDPITMKTLTPTKSVFQQTPLHLHAVLVPHTREVTYRQKANTDYDNRMVRRHTKSIQEEDDET